ncbi:MAG: cytochrome c oxidase assembly protein [Dermabacter sp.]|nr:cytochrome c oxidase assembly protein [Dermabacter sp.]
MSAEAIRRRGGRRPLTWALVILLVGTVAGILGLVLTGELGPGTLARVVSLSSAALAVKVAEYLALTLAFGYAFTLCLLQPGSGRQRGDVRSRLDAAQKRLLHRSLVFTGAFAVLLALTTYLAYVTASGSFSPDQLGYFLTSSELGRISITAGIVALASLGVGALTKRLRGAGWSAALLTASVVTLGFLGHAGSSVDHGNAVNAMIVHLLGLVVWLGPLLVFLIEGRRVPGATLATWLERYSPWALFALVALAFSGVVNGLIRLESPLDLVSTGYGALILAKAVGTLAIAALGFAQRRRVIAALGHTRGRGAHAEIAAAPAGLFARLALTETVVAALIIGLSAALGRSEPPVPQYVPPEEYRVLSLVGYEAPTARFDIPALFTQWHIDWVFLAAALLFAGLYLAGVRRLAHRGDAWPLQRTVFWLLGCAAFILVMNAGPAAYGRIRFDAHMVQHMSLMIIVPPLWVLGAPVTLMSRALAPRSDGSRGMREWVLAILHSGYATVVSSPPVAGFLFAGSLVLFYFSPIFTWAMFSHAGHLFMTIHFLLAGYLFAWVIIGIDPATRPINPALKLLTLLVTLSFHAFFGIAVVSATWIIGGPWYEALGMFDVPELEFLQLRGGSIMWGVSEIPTVLYAIVAAVQWKNSEERRARQFDRKAERDGDAELHAYNDYLASMQEPRGGAGTPGA